VKRESQINKANAINSTPKISFFLSSDMLLKIPITDKAPNYLISAKVEDIDTLK
jgi:hypothetical protein